VGFKERKNGGAQHCSEPLQNPRGGGSLGIQNPICNKNSMVLLPSSQEEETCALTFVTAREGRTIIGMDRASPLSLARRRKDKKGRRGENKITLVYGARGQKGR